jgi:phosphocarrier protein HPr
MRFFMEVIEKILIVSNIAGLHTRAAARIVEAVKNFNAEITLEKDGATADAKSIMAILILAAAQNSEIIVRATGDQANEAILALTSLFNSKFGEE